MFLLILLPVVVLSLRYAFMQDMGWRNPQLLVASATALALLVCYRLNKSGHYVAASSLAAGTLILAIFAGTYATLSGAMEPYYSRDSIDLLVYLLLPLLLAATLLPGYMWPPVVGLVFAVALSTPLLHSHVSWLDVLYGPALYLAVASALLLLLGRLLRASRHAGFQRVAEREERYRSLFEQSPDAVFLVASDGTVEAVNHAGLALFGYEQGELEGRNVREIYAVPEEREMVVANVERKGSLKDEPLRLRKKDGSVMDCMVSVRPRHDSAGLTTGYQSVVRDVTERMRTEEELRLKGQLLDLAHDVVLLIDPGGEIVYANAACAALTGYSLAELTGMNMRQLNTREGAEQVPTLISTMLREGGAEFDAVWVSRDGQPVDVEVRSQAVESRGRPLLLSVVRDVTRRKADQADLRLRSEMLDLASDAVLLHDLNGKLLYANEAAAHQTGYTRSELTGMTLRDLDDPETSARMRNRMAELMNKREIAFEGGHRRKDGVVIPVDVRARLVDWEDRGIVLAVARDIRERKKAEAALRESEEKYRTLFERSMDAVCIVSADGTLLEANKAYLELFGYDAAGVGRVNVREHYVNPAERDEYLRVLERDGVVVGHHTKVKRTDGTVMDCVRSSVAHYDVSGRITSIQTVTHDITEDRRLAMALADELTRRRILVEQSRDGIVVLDEDGSVVEANRKFAEMLGYSPQEVLQLHVSDWDVPTPRDRLNEMIRTVDESGDHFETQHRRKDGTVYDVEISTNAAVFAGRKLIFCVCRDISGRKRAERELRESEEKYRALFEQSMDAIYINTLDGVTIEANQPWLDLFGYTREELRTVNTADTYADPAERADFLRRIEQSGFVADEVRLRKKDGTVFDCQRAVIARKDDSGNVVAFQGVFRDITARKRAEQELRESEQRYRLIADDTADIIWRMDLNMVFTYVNPAIQRVFGFTPREWVGSSLADHCSPSEFAGIRATAAHEIQNYSRAQEAGSGILFEATMLDKAGGELPVEVRAKLIVGAEGRPIALHGITRDIRDRRRAEQELRDSEARFRALVEHTGLAMTITNAEGSILDCNDVFLQRLGYTRAEALGMRVTDMYANPEDRERIISRTLSDGYVRDVEVEFKRKDGSRVYVSLTSALVSQQGGLVIVSQALDITARKATEQELLRSREELQRSAEQLQELAIYLEDAREKERTGIARELHDQLGQALTALTMDLDGVRRAATAGEPVPADRLDRMATLLNDTVNDVRRISSDLRPGILDDAGLVAAIEWQLDRFRERSDIDCTLEAHSDDAGIDRARSTALFRVFQELLTNVARHAGATQVRVDFECDSSACSLSVSDDGRGITDEQASSTASLGIIGVRERLRPLGGDIQFLRRRPKGTTARVTVPVGNADRHVS